MRTIALGVALWGWLGCCTSGVEVARADEFLVGAALAEQGAYSCLSPEEAQLFQGLNAYRRENGRPEVRNSRSLDKVARIHAIDLVDNRPELGRDARGRECTLHSWSDEGFWSAVCYTSDHAGLAGMLSKPEEITGGEYASVAYETVYWTSAEHLSPSRVLRSWQQSPRHNALILENVEWRGSRWQALGVGIHRNVAVIWFGALEDPLGPLPQCAQGWEEASTR